MSFFRRTVVAKLIVLGLALAGLHSGLKPAQGASPTARASMLKPDERATLLQYARDTWRGFDKLLLPSNLPADGLRRQGENWAPPWMQTSPTNIAAYLWSVLAAERLHLISAAEGRSRLDRTLATLEGMDRTHGFFVNEIDPRAGPSSSFRHSIPDRPGYGSRPLITPGWRSR